MVMIARCFSVLGWDRSCRCKKSWSYNCHSL